mmetsp:Transcript_18694/g.52210  ORF Transcript_18694/g.52210 Transcript_18694/m.52210 type:complete len:295 (-) Transcript_18694:84-968(-)
MRGHARAAQTSTVRRLCVLRVGRGCWRKGQARARVSVLGAARRGPHAAHPAPSRALGPLGLLVRIVRGHARAAAVAAGLLGATFLQVLARRLDEFLKLLPLSPLLFMAIVRVLHHAIQRRQHLGCRVLPRTEGVDDEVDVLLPTISACGGFDLKALLFLVHLPNNEVLVHNLYDDVLQLTRIRDVQGNLQVGELDESVLARHAHNGQQLELPALCRIQLRQLCLPGHKLRIRAIGKEPQQLQQPRALLCTGERLHVRAVQELAEDEHAGVLQGLPHQGLASTALCGLRQDDELT